MPIDADFEEKEYEVWMNAFLAREAHIQATAYRRSGSSLVHYPAIAAPGQVLEKYLGFDIAILLDPLSTTYAMLYGSPTTPPVPSLVHGPAYLTEDFSMHNCFLQYKRPQFCKANHRQPVWKRREMWRFDVRSGKPPYRNHEQLEALVRLNQGDPFWAVRYACPATHLRSELKQFYHNGELLRQSIFVNPELLARENGMWHDFWTFVCDNGVLVGQGNPDGNEMPMETGNTFWEQSEYAPGEDFGAIVSRLQHQAQHVRQDSQYFTTPQKINGNWETPEHWVNTAVANVGRDVMEGFYELAYERRRELGTWSIPSRRRLEQVMPHIGNAVEVAATAQTLDLEWVITTRPNPRRQ